jgi:hypothetical protein
MAAVIVMISATAVTTIISPDQVYKLGAHRQDVKAS